MILDFQHFFNLLLSDHKRLVNQLKSIFGHKLLPYSYSMKHVTLDYMKEHSYQVLLVYRGDISHVEEVLWPAMSFPTPWPDTFKIPVLIDFINQGLKNRNCALGFVSQCVLTPTVWFAFRHIFSKSFFVLVGNYR